MRWFAKLSNGEVVGEQDEPGGLSTWRRLLARCEREGLYLTSLCLVVNGTPAWCRPNAPGYWQAKLAFAATGGSLMPAPGEPPRIEEAATGVGWVEGDLIFNIWGSADGRMWFGPPRPVTGQRQIIWAPGHKGRHGGADERVVIIDGRTLRESDGEPVSAGGPALNLAAAPAQPKETD
jgi:hypothetical protein